jgi:hypothetical protein
MSASPSLESRMICCSEKADEAESTDSKAGSAGTAMGRNDIGRGTDVWTAQDIEGIRQRMRDGTRGEEELKEGPVTVKGSQIQSTVNGNGEVRVKAPESLGTVKSVIVDSA